MGNVDIEEMLEEEAAGLAITLSGVVMDKFAHYYEFLITQNEKVNLTRITEKKEVYIKHFYDSLTLLSLPEVNKAVSLIDVGSGAGFPAIVIKMVRPHIGITIVDSLKKRILFLEELVSRLGLKGVKLIHNRAEEAGQTNELRERFEVATARAVAKLSVLSEYCLPLVQKGGAFVAMKGESAGEEITGASKAVRMLGGKFLREEELMLPEKMGKRSLVVIGKMRPTPREYPRKAGTPSREPL